MNTTTEKRCSTCKEIKSSSDFSSRKDTKDGLASACRTCHNLSTRKYYLSEKGQSSQKLWRQSATGKASMKATSRKYSRTEKRKAKRPEYDRRYGQSEKGKVARHKALDKYKESPKGKLSEQKYLIGAQERHPERYLARSAVNRATRRKILPPVKSLLCSSCGNQADHYHHYLGYSEEHHLDVVPVCIKCHNKFHNS